MPEAVSAQFPRVLVLANQADQTDAQLHMLESIPHTIGDSAEAFAEAAADAEALLYWTGSRETLRDVVARCPKLRWIHSRNAGVDNILFPELVEYPIPLTNSSGVFSPSLGEFAIAGMLWFAKDIPRLLRNQQARRWEQFDVDQLTGHTLGIVGYGDIGRAVAVRARAMGMRILAVKRHFPDAPDPLIDEFHKPAELHAMLSVCDYVAVAAPLTPETRHMISTAEFAAMKPTAVIINVGRGPVIDQAAMTSALAEHKIRGAALDVFEQEPLDPGDPLWGMENVLVSPHSTDHTRDWLDNAMRLFLEQYERFRQGQPLRNVVNKKLGY